MQGKKVSGIMCFLSVTATCIYYTKDNNNKVGVHIAINLQSLKFGEYQS